MDKKIKAKWLKALRSGEYKRGKEFLYQVCGDEHRFCCLGVLAHIASPVPWRRAPGHSGVYMFNGKAGLLPVSFRNKIGLDEKAQDKLIGMNDGGKSFKTIANWIEKNL